jgi:hypothetical protein
LGEALMQTTEVGDVAKEVCRGYESEIEEIQGGSWWRFLMACFEATEESEARHLDMCH